MKFLFILFIYFFVSINSQAAVWQTTYKWDNTWEQKYSDWVSEEWNQFIFSDKKSPYYGIATDCADASYAMRIIFAYENGLAFAVNDPTRKNSKIPISNSMSRFDKYPQGFPRIKAFVNFISAVLFTGNMTDDTVPVALTPKYLIPGIVFVKPRVHSYQIKDWSPQGIPITINSTTPYSVKDMHKYISFPAYIPEDIKFYSDGYRRFKRPNELYKPTSSLPGYSIQQYIISESVEFDSVLFNGYIISQTLTRAETKEEKIKRLMFNICYATFNRASVINESTDYFLKIRSEGRSCMNAQEFDQYSTFTRDKRLTEHYLRLQKFLEKTNNLQGERFPYKPYAIDLFNLNPETFKRNREQFIRFCDIPYKENASLTVREVWKRIKYKKLVQNPNTTNEWRWGDYIRPFTTNCPKFDEVH